MGSGQSLKQAEELPEVTAKVFFGELINDDEARLVDKAVELEQRLTERRRSLEALREGILGARKVPDSELHQFTERQVNILRLERDLWQTERDIEPKIEERKNAQNESNAGQIAKVPSEQ